MKTKTFTDQFSTRFQLVSSNHRATCDWVFLPGGPGLGAEYLRPLALDLHLPGRAWLMDLPANGDYYPDAIRPDYNFNQWSDIFIPAIKQLDHPIIVGHSFGGMFPLLFPQLEDILAGLVILNSAPSLWMEESARIARERQLPSLESSLGAMINNPCKETGMTALLACAPYYFPNQFMETGKALLNQTTFNCHAALWWFKKVIEINFSARWIPEKVKTLIIGATYDAITPFTIFDNDERFVRENIHKHLVKDGGHFPWIERPLEVKEQFELFYRKPGYLNK